MKKNIILYKEYKKKIVNNKASMNWGLSDELKKAFPDTIAVNKEFIITLLRLLNNE